ncbi:hypothetical protein BCV69DRAFT_275405 [Microstroma glucosiphilum]|uniref:Transmembrane protein n=1 Tax=Pseudomicrostroma glucosiphilum TaxID=1684307 RepID=A0A316ULH5_9BASI|nr:hypothetical protein BCV69DRAFT_275405 [Pseudomicrostroma glucosiphilum]PWN24055.1 hypothetical protein BCV69DRAFT_275405 [Pseudomicrostroma glucosiphilum]
MPRPSSSSSPAAQPSGRRYYFSAGAVGRGALTSGIVSPEATFGPIGKRGGHRTSAETDTVDLDLSFEFVSPAEAEQSDAGHSSQSSHQQLSETEELHRRLPQAQPVASGSQVAMGDEAVNAVSDTSSPSRPRGMAASISSSTRRKQPPEPLTFDSDSRKQNAAHPPLGSTQSTTAQSTVVSGSQPQTPSDATLPNSAGPPKGRRRAGTVSSTPPSAPPCVPLPSVPTAEHSAIGPSFAAVSTRIAEQRERKARQQRHDMSLRESYYSLQGSVPTVQIHDVASTQAAEAQTKPAQEYEPQRFATTSRDYHSQAMKVNYSSSSSQFPDSLYSESSPVSVQHSLSTPGTPYSSVFDARSESAKMLVSHSNASSFAKTGKMIDSELMTGVITEEPVEEHVSLSVRGFGDGPGLPRSHTAEWLQAQRRRAVSAAMDDSGEVDPIRGSEETASSESMTTSESDVSSLPASGRQLLIINTSDSSHEVDVELGRNDGKQKGPWAESPMLLTPSRQAQSAIGLGLVFDTKDSRGLSGNGFANNNVLIANRMQLSDPSLLAGEVTPQAKTFSKPRGPFSESPVPTMKAGVSLGFDAKSGAQSRSRYSSIDAAKSSSLSPRIRSLALVDHRQQSLGQSDGASTPARPGFFARRHTLGLNPLEKQSRDEWHETERSAPSQLSPPHSSAPTAPRSAPLPSTSTFASGGETPTVFEMSKRSSKHVRRASRLHYVASPDCDNSGEVRLAMPTPALTSERRVVVSQSGRTARSSSGGPPRSRLSWGYAPRSDIESPTLPMSPTESSAVPSSPWLDFAEDGSGMAATSARRSELLKRSESGRRQPSSGSNVTHFSSVLESEGGLRRRSTLEKKNQRTTLTIPPTAVIRPFVSTHDRRASVHSDVLVQDGSLRLGHIQEDKGLRQLRLMGDLPPEEYGSRPMSVFVPVPTLQAHLRAKALQEQQERVQLRTRAAMHEPLPRSPLSFGHDLLSSSGRMLDSELPSRTLFFLGFLGMPWLWLLGGWALNSDGMLGPAGGAGRGRVEFYTHEPSMQEVQRQLRQQGQGQGALQRRSRVTSRNLSVARGHLSTIYTDGNDQRDYAGESFEVLDSEHGLHRMHQERRDVYNEPSKAAQSHFSLASSDGCTGRTSPQTLTSAKVDRLPRNTRRSLGSFLNPHPEVALFHSPVRSVAFSDGPSDEWHNAEQGLHRGHASLSARRRARRSGVSGLDHISDVEEPATDVTMTLESEDHRYSTGLSMADDRRYELRDEVSVGHLRSGSRTTLSMLEGLQGYSSAPAEQVAVKLTARQRLALMERYVLLNRFMAITSTLAVFAGFGVALNAVAMNF